VKHEGGIRNSVEFIVWVREFWSCYLFIKPVLYVLLLVVGPSFRYESFSVRNFFSQDGNHWCVFACKSKFFANYRPVNIRRRRSVTCVAKCFRVAVHRKTLAIDTLMIFPFYLANVCFQSLPVGYCANDNSKFSLGKISLTHFSHLTSKIRQAAKSRFPRVAALNRFSKITFMVSVANTMYLCQWPA